LVRAGYAALRIKTVVSEIDRIAVFSDAEKFHELGLGYKLIGVFGPAP
jgi:hypothetical protein